MNDAQVKRAQEIAVKVQLLHLELFAMGLPATARRMALVNERLGYELAEKMAQSGLVGKEEKKRRERHAKFDEREADRLAEISNA
jgi:hypothetical protein